MLRTNSFSNVIALHLLPFPFRGAKAPYLWIFHTALSKLGANAAYILSADYLDAGGGASHLSSSERENLAHASYSLIPDKAMRAFAESYPTRELAWRDYLTSDVPQLNAIYERALEALPGIEAVRAIITWCNCPSLVTACRRRKIQVIHQELGSLRPPGYRPTIYFDYCGVNGNTEVEARYSKLKTEAENLPVFSRNELLRIFSAPELELDVQYKRGVALQVEDDSNIIAYANGFNSIALINQASEGVTPAEVLVRDHPMGHFDYRCRDHTDPARDESSSTAGFLSKIAHLYTISSSLGVEALLHGIPVTCLGDAPYKFIASEPVNSAEFTKKLSFYCLNYLVPEEFCLDDQYLLWRLSAPSEREIQEKHLSAHTSRSLPPTLFAQAYFDAGDGYNEQNSIKRPLRPGKQQLVFSGFPATVGIQALRLDPLNDHVALRIENVFLRLADASLSASSISSTNADYSDGVVHCFMQKDPITSIDISGQRVEGLKEVIVELEVIASGQAKVRDWFHARSIEALTGSHQIIEQRNLAVVERERIEAERQAGALECSRLLHDLQEAIAKRDSAAAERDQIVADRQGILLDKDRVICELRDMTLQRDQAATARDEMADERDRITLERNRVVTELQQMTDERQHAVDACKLAESACMQITADKQVLLLEKAAVLVALEEMTAQRDEAGIHREQAAARCNEIASDCQQALVERDKALAQLHQVTAQRDKATAESEQLSADRQIVARDRDRIVLDLNQMTGHRDRAAAQRDQAVIELDAIRANRCLLLSEKERLDAHLTLISRQRDEAVWQRDRVTEERDALATSIHLVKRTLSWRITAPLRWPRQNREVHGTPFFPDVSRPLQLSEALEAPVPYPSEASSVAVAERPSESASESRHAKLDSSELFAQLFVDNGDGFKEETSIRRSISLGKQRLIFTDFASASPMRSLRLDPVNDHAAVRISQVQLVNETGDHMLCTVTPLNAAHADDSEYWFPHNDPQFLIRIPEQVTKGVQEVAVDLELVVVGDLEVADRLRQREPHSITSAESPVLDASDIHSEAFEVLSGRDASLPAITLERDESKLIAFYLPQYHRIQENSEWWGAGFTEWTNVVKGKPNFEGHRQPHLPRELGFYDLSSVEVMREQAEMAKLYGVHGFCFYHYWFSGRRILEKPLENFLNSDIDLKYCLCWANENWTRTWDGDTRSVLMEQKYAESDPEEFIKALLPFFFDSRYIRVDDKPMLVVYRAKEIPNVKVVFAAWKGAAVQAGLKGLHINVVDFYDVSHPGDVDADALTEFPPHKFNGAGSNPDLMPSIVNPEFKGSIVDYAKVVTQSLRRSAPDFTLYRAAMPSWDNTARRQNTPTIIYGAHPELFEEWLRYLRAYTRDHFLGREDNFIFVNAWNEWGEGCHLEPDQAVGLGNLEAVAKSAWFEPSAGLSKVEDRVLDAARDSITARQNGLGHS